MNTHTLDRKRIVFFTNDLVLGGSERQALYLARFLKEHHHCKIFFIGSKRSRTDFTGLLDKEGFKWKIMPDPIMIPNLYRTFKIPRKIMLYIHNILQLIFIRPDILISFVYNSNVNIGLIWKFTGARLFIWNQRSAGIEMNNMSKIEKIAIQNTKNFIANSEICKQVLIQQIGLSPEKIQIIPNAIEIRNNLLSSQEVRKIFKIPEHAFVVGMIANFSLYKDHKTMLSAWKILLSEQRSDYSLLLILAGKPQETYKEVMEYIKQIEIPEPNYKVFTDIDDVYKIIPAFQIGVLSSASEGCPNSLLECMACGIPVAGSDIPGIRYAVGSENYKYLVPPENPERLAEKIKEMMSIQMPFTQIGTINRKRIAEHFEINFSCRQYVEYIVSQF